MSPSSRAHIGPEALDVWLATYQPKWVDDDTWARVGPWVRRNVARLRPLNIETAVRWALVLTRLAIWGLAQGMALDPEVLLDPATVERYCAGLPATRSRATYRSDLRRIGPLLTTSAPWEPKNKALAHRHVARPYSRAEMDQLRRAADHQATAGRRDHARALLGLGAGAGLDGRWVGHVSYRDVFREDDIVLVGVVEPAARLVPVLAEWEDVVFDLAQESTKGMLIAPRSTGSNKVSAVIAKLEVGQGCPRFNASRLRSTWLATHLDRGTRLPELMRAAGLEGITTISDLLVEIPFLGDDEARRMLRGQP